MSDNMAYWKRAHRDWRFWIGVVLMVSAMVVYVMSDNLLLRPGMQRHASPTSRP